MMHAPRRRGRPSERGQFFAGYIVAILLIITVTSLVLRSMKESKRVNEGRIYRQLAVNIAQSGFEDGLSYFRNQPGGVYLGAYPSVAPTNQSWVTPWPLWPDAAFLPQSQDTDYFNQISYTAAGLSVTAGGIVRTVPINYYSLTSTSSELRGSNLWGRYVLRRQSTRNWSPGPNTFSAASFTDPEAVHDITHLKGGTVPGAGNTWSLFSRSYIFAYPTDLTVPAAFEGGSLLNAPKQTYMGRRLLLATASVYGEVSRINFQMPYAAIFAGGKVTINDKGSVSGQGQKALAQKTSNYVVNSGGAMNPSAPLTGVGPPTVAYCFPGQTAITLKDIALSLDPSKVGDITCFPVQGSLNFDAQTSSTAFYYITSSCTFLKNDLRVMSGVGMIYIEGNLTIQNYNNSDWTGVVFVNGNVDIRDRATVSGTIIATGTVKVGDTSDFNKCIVEYNPDSIATVQSLLENFQVLKHSVKTSTR